jgi:hypothetical protein
MFPVYDYTKTLEMLSETVATADNVLKSFSFDFDNKEFVVKDGSPELVDEYEATEQWIQKFLSTDLGTLEIYDDYKFGTSYKKLIGSKSFNGGYVESEIEREIREGFPLCPSIQKIVSYMAEKQGTKLALTIGVKLKSGASAKMHALLGV